MTPVEPIVATRERRVIFAEGQDEYFNLPAAVDKLGTVTTEWEFSAEDLEKIVNGGKLRLKILTFNRPLQPVMLEVIE